MEILFLDWNIVFEMTFCKVSSGTLNPAVPVPTCLLPVPTCLFLLEVPILPMKCGWLMNVKVTDSLTHWQSGKRNSRSLYEL